MRDDMGMPLPIEVGPRQAMFDTAPELNERGNWLCLNIEPSCAWPTRPQSVEFAGQCVWIIPITQEAHAGVALRRPVDLSEDDAEGILYRFLSVLAWREDCGFAVAYRTGGSWPSMMGLNKKMGFAIRDLFDFTEMLCPVDEQPRIALALMREARSLNHDGYAFLSYWRVLEVVFGRKAKKRIAWMDTVLPNLKGAGVVEAQASIAALGVVDVGAHLYESGRCAVAHAAGHPVVNPDDPTDARRLHQELPIVRELAIRAIEDHLGIFTRSTEYSRHLYELRGWRELFGDDLVGRLVRGEKPDPKETVDLPAINIRLRQNRSYTPFESMEVASLQLDRDKVDLTYRSKSGLIEFRFRLDFAAERLQLDVTQGIFAHDDGSVGAAENQREIQRFIRDYFLNGELQIWSVDTGVLLSRLDAFLPLNCFIDLDASNEQIAAAQAVVDRRKAERAGAREAMHVAR